MDEFLPKGVCRECSPKGGFFLLLSEAERRHLPQTTVPFCTSTSEIAPANIYCLSSHHFTAPPPVFLSTANGIKYSLNKNKKADLCKRVSAITHTSFCLWSRQTQGLITRRRLLPVPGGRGARGPGGGGDQRARARQKRALRWQTTAPIIGEEAFKSVQGRPRTGLIML